MGFDSETQGIARERLIELYAEYKALMAVPADKRDKQRILSISDDIRKLMTTYRIDLNSIETEAKNKSEEITKQIKNEAEAKKAEEERKRKESEAQAAKEAEEAAEKNTKINNEKNAKLKQLEKFYLDIIKWEVMLGLRSPRNPLEALGAQRRGFGEALGDLFSASEENARESRKAMLEEKLKLARENYAELVAELKKDYGLRTEDITALERSYETIYKQSYESVYKSERDLSEAKFLLSRRDSEKKHRIEKHVKRKEGSLAKRVVNPSNVLTALSAAGLIGGILLTTSASAVLPILPVLGVVSYIASAGQKRAITMLDERQNNKLTVYYTNILNKQNKKLDTLKLQKKGLNETSKKFIRISKKEAKKNKQIARTTHKIAKISKRNNPMKTEVVATGIQIAASYLLATSVGALAPQILIGVALYGLTWLAKGLHKDKKK